MRSLVVAASVCGFALAGLGAVGAHMMTPTVEEAFQSVGQITETVWPKFNDVSWNSAMLYGFGHVAAALAVSVMPMKGRLLMASGWAFIAGVVLFSFTIMGKEIALQEFLPATGREETIARYDQITIVTPFGGIAFMLGWLLLGASALFARRTLTADDRH